jgi:hypothetical protein
VWLPSMRPGCRWPHRCGVTGVAYTAANRAGKWVVSSCSISAASASRLDGVEGATHDTDEHGACGVNALVIRGHYA